MAALEKIAQEKDEASFIAAINAINWQNHPVENYLQAIELAMMAGAHYKARLLSAQAMNAFPDSAEAQKLAYILAPPQIKSGIPKPAKVDLCANREWLLEHASKYKNQWIALHNGKLIGQAPTLNDLISQVGNPKDKGIFVTQV